MTTVDIASVTKRLGDAQRALHAAKSKADHCYGRLMLLGDRLRLARDVVEASSPVAPTEGRSELAPARAEALVETQMVLEEYPVAVRRYRDAVREVEAALKQARVIGQETEAEVTAATKALQESLPVTPAGDQAGENPPN